MIRTTLAAMPRRSTVLAAKAAVITAVTLAAGTPAVLGSVLAGRLILPGRRPAAPPPRRVTAGCRLVQRTVMG